MKEPDREIVIDDIPIFPPEGKTAISPTTEMLSGIVIIILIVLMYLISIPYQIRSNDFIFPLIITGLFVMIGCVLFSSGRRKALKLKKKSI